MKYAIHTLFTLVLLSFFSITCNKETVDIRKPAPVPIFPDEQPDALNSALLIYGKMQEGDMPETKNPNLVNVTVSVPSASITNDNFLFLPFAFDVQGDLEGIYLQVEGANNYWDAEVDLNSPNANSYAIAIGIPANIQTGNFVVSYKLYDSANNVSSPKSINVSVVASENHCGTGQGFPRVEGNDGITVKTYDFGDVPGDVKISYYMYTQKDRMDIRYNGQWVRSTSPDLLTDGAAPPFRKCDEASPAQGFVSGGGTFTIPYDPAISREISIYVSGCLEGGTLWYFDVVCPGNQNPPSTLICGNGTAQDYYDPEDPKYHHYPTDAYELTTEICDPEQDPDCTRSNVFNAMLKQSNFIAPSKDQTPVFDCKVTWVAYLPKENPVVSKVNPSSYSVTNYTLADYKDSLGIPQTHFLHPGKVTRTIKEKDGKIVVCTEGVGTGRLGWFNESPFATKPLWQTIVDGALKSYWDAQ